MTTTQMTTQSIQGRDGALPVQAFSAVEEITFDHEAELPDVGVYWLVRSGMVRRVHLEGRPVLVDLYGAGAVASAPTGRDATVERLYATADTTLVRVPQARLEEVSLRQPETMTDLVHAFEHQKRVLRGRLALHRERRVQEQVKNLLDLLALEVGVPCRHGRPGSLDVVGLTHQDLADLLGSSRPYVTTTIAQLQREGWLTSAAPRQICLGPAVRFIP